MFIVIKTGGKLPLILKKRIYENTRDMKKRKVRDDLERHNLESNLNFHFKDSKILF